MRWPSDLSGMGGGDGGGFVEYRLISMMTVLVDGWVGDGKGGGS